MATAEDTLEEGAPALGKAERDKLARMGEAFDKIDRLLVRLGLQGLQRATASSAAELRALQQTAHHAGLVRVERQLEVLATHVQRYTERDPLFTMDDYMATVNRIWLLNHQARRRHAAARGLDELTDVVGEARRRYDEVPGALVLQPLGATGWVTDTDFVGVTVYFHVEGRPGEIYQASNCKPCMYFGRDPRRLLREAISDHVDFTIFDMAHGAFEFRKAKLSRDGRLSLHKELLVARAPYQGARAYAALAVGDWIALVDRLRAGEAHPVEGAGGALVYVEPARFGAPLTDEKHARFVVEVYDGRGAPMTLEIPLRPENNFLIDNVEFMLGAGRKGAGAARKADRGTTGGTAAAAPRPPYQPDAMFGRAWIAEGRLKFFPYTAIYNRAVVSTEHGQRRVNEVHLALEALHKVTLTGE